MYVYHEIAPDSLNIVLREGIKRTSTGSKSDDLIKQTDDFLDEGRPYGLQSRDVSRSDNLYAYLADGNAVVDISDGSLVPLTDFITGSQQRALRLSVDPARCFVSDLDAYDAVKNAMSANRSHAELGNLRDTYWIKIAPLESYVPGTIRRPEIMITYDIAPHDIAVADE